ncbi:MAG: peptidase dimerization domain-containing protein [Pyramidobacter sp.]|nr:peptidase dimerization domain-containing protein [Pyramidobacter sp.]
MDAARLKELAFAQIDKDRDAILSFGWDIYRHPETGYRETRTADCVAKVLESCGLKPERNVAYTGVRARSSRAGGPRLTVMGELDSVICRDHPDCDKATGAMHACGHNIQLSVMYAVACALEKTGVAAQLDGAVDYVAVPAEEYIELDYRKQLKDAGKIAYYSGKAEMTRQGYFDDTDMCVMIHNWPMTGGAKIAARNTGTGFIGKKVRYLGRQAHAGAAPWDGINALNMAMIAINSMNTQRETFRDTDCVRVHQILTRAGDLLNSVPAEVDAEITVRAMNIPALLDANEKVNRSIHGAAIALGGHAVVEDSPGQMPLHSNGEMARLFIDNARAFYGDSEIVDCFPATASFDMGDLSMIMPVLHSLSSGVTGGLHSAGYRVTDEENAFITPAKIVAATVIDLLCDGAEKAKRVIADFKPELTRAEYLELLKKLEKTIEY